MRERLEKWRQNTLHVSSQEKIKASPKPSLQRKDYGDDYENEVINQRNKNA